MGLVTAVHESGPRRGLVRVRWGATTAAGATGGEHDYAYGFKGLFDVVAIGTAAGASVVGAVVDLATTEVTTGKRMRMRRCR